MNSAIACMVARREQPPALPEDDVIVEHSATETIAHEIDISLCDACGLLRMKGPGHEMTDDLPRDVVAALISQVRQDIGRLTQEHRESFQTIERNNRDSAQILQRQLDTVCSDVTTLKLAKEHADGKSDGIKMVLSIIITLSTMLGGAVVWIVSHIPWTGNKP